MKENIKNVIENFKNLKILVIGDAILDTYVKGTPDRVCREAPVLVYNLEEQEHQCGGAANTAINVATLGAETFYLTVVGKDANSKELFGVLKQNKVHTEYIIKDNERSTIAKKRITASSNILIRIDEGTTTEISDACKKELIQKVTGLYEQVDAVILSDYGYGIITTSLTEALKAINIHNKPIVVDARDLTKYKALKPDAVKPNYEETVKLLGIEKATTNRPAQIIEHAKKLQEITGANKVCVTLDADGVVLFEKGKNPYRILSVPRDNKNAVGAGDTFISALTLALAFRVKGQVAAELAAAAAAIVVQKEGTVGCTNNELKAYFNSLPKQITSLEDLASLTKELRKNGKKIVFTNGCFDILHKGHIALLNKAREAGDILIVGVNNDASIRKVKGPERPINSLEDRITVLSGLESVDYLISFEEDSPIQLIKVVHPDVFVKGAGYTEQSIPEAPLLKKLRCEVMIVPNVKDHSTTHIINKIRDINEELDVEIPHTAFVKTGRINGAHFLKR
ncbi:MAG: Bifunctional protein hldE [Segetibacter sp.]|nr:Bifunctional protein hldE [Segetibacter sp.]